MPLLSHLQSCHKYTKLGILSPWAFVPMGFCPPGFLSSLDFVRLDIVLWVFVQWDFVLIPIKTRRVTRSKTPSEVSGISRGGGNAWLFSRHAEVETRSLV